MVIELTQHLPECRPNVVAHDIQPEKAHLNGDESDVADVLTKPLDFNGGFCSD